jgi:hypothetical protein
MKFNSNSLLIKKLICYILICSCLALRSSEGSGLRPAEPKTKPDPPPSPADAAFKRVLDYVRKIAEEKMKSTNLLEKKKLNGALSSGYSEELIQKAKDSRQDKKKWNKLMALPTEIWRTCLYPESKVNYVRWCEGSFSGAKNKDESKK